MAVANLGEELNKVGGQHRGAALDTRRADSALATERYSHLDVALGAAKASHAQVWVTAEHDILKSSFGVGLEGAIRALEAAIVDLKKGLQVVCQNSPKGTEKSITLTVSTGTVRVSSTDEGKGQRTSIISRKWSRPYAGSFSTVIPRQTRPSTPFRNNCRHRVPVALDSTVPIAKATQEERATNSIINGFSPSPATPLEPALSRLLMGKTIEAESTPVETASVALQETDQPAFDPDNLDRDTSPTKDFYQFAMGGYLARKPIPADRASFGVDAESGFISAEGEAMYTVCGFCDDFPT